MYVTLGATTADQDMDMATLNHSPYFQLDENALRTGTELFVNWALSYNSTSAK